ncbi:MAG: GDYXXLXY domain-containing protein [Lentisphaerae bacterium]|nr:GDYXXLXY domain-containing protein [Lentisphaerota bacterium]
MRKIIVAAIILAQVALLLVMAIGRERIVRHGERVWLKTSPVDPRDLFRGDYVVLNYEISSLPKASWSEELAAWLQNEANQERSLREKTLYVSLERGPGDVATAVKADLTPPASGLFIRGVCQPRRWGWSQNSLTRLHYGIESYFVEQGSGLELERGRPKGIGGTLRVPLEIEVAISKRGEAVILRHRWAEALVIGHVKETVKVDGEDGGYDELLSLQVYRSPNAEETALLLPADLRTLTLVCDQQRFAIGPTDKEAADRPFTQDDIRIIPPTLTGKDIVKIPVARYHREQWFSADGSRVLGKSDNDWQVAIIYEPPAAPPGLPDELLPGLCRRRLLSDDAWWIDRNAD